METMKATVFRGVNDIALEEVPRPRAGPARNSAQRLFSQAFDGTFTGAEPVHPRSINVWVGRLRRVGDR
jgi:hypothetical protein